MLRLSSLVLVLALGASGLDGVSLRFKPTDESGPVLKDLSRVFKAKKVTVQPFTDARQDKQLIGRNTQKSTPRDVTTKDDVGAWCSGQLSELLSQAGVAVVPEGGELVITGQVTRFMMDEENTYRGVVALNLTVKNAEGTELWSGLVAADAKRWGRSYKEENYMETLSDAFLRAVSALLTDPALSSKLE
jgi:hypothetical protein